MDNIPTRPGCGWVAIDFSRPALRCCVAFSLAAAFLNSCTCTGNWRHWRCPHGEDAYELRLTGRSFKRDVQPDRTDAAGRLHEVKPPRWEISWHSGFFLPRGWSLSGAEVPGWEPRVTALRKSMKDDLGNEYEVGELRCVYKMTGYQVHFCIDQSKIAVNATKLYVDVLFHADKLVFHMRDTVIRIDKVGDKWLSESLVREIERDKKGK